MKRILSIAIAIAAMAIAVTGCSKDNYGKWETRVLLTWSQGISQERSDNLKACIGEVEYFNEAQKYEGYRNDVIGNALEDFGNACRQIDSEKLDRNLYFGEIITLTLVMSAPGSSEGEIIGQVRIAGKPLPKRRRKTNRSNILQP